MNSIKESDAFKKGCARGLEDIRLFIPNIDKDKVSDMVANLIKIPLIDYTQEQCKLLGVDGLLCNYDIGYCWDKENWTRGHKNVLFFDDKPYLLFPKNLVSESKHYAANEFFRIYVLEYLQQKNIDKDTALVRKTYNKKGEVINKRVYKKDIVADMEKRGEYFTKDWLARFSIENPEIYDKFKQETINKISNSEYQLISKEEESKIIDQLIYELKNITSGTENATKYHHLISGILELLFYPYIAHPKIEKEINEGRKRIDLVFTNIAEKGFFNLLPSSYNIPSSFIIVECKNYTRDVNNPELDQIAGRFSPNRGKFGIICCRSIDDEKAFIKREKDTVIDQRGWIIHFTDNDIINLLNMRKNNDSIDDYLIRKYEELIAS